MKHVDARWSKTCVECPTERHAAPLGWIPPQNGKQQFRISRYRYRVLTVKSTTANEEDIKGGIYEKLKEQVGSIQQLLSCQPRGTAPRTLPLRLCKKTSWQTQCTVDCGVVCPTHTSMWIQQWPNNRPFGGNHVSFRHTFISTTLS